MAMEFGLETRFDEIIETNFNYILFTINDLDRVVDCSDYDTQKEVFEKIVSNKSARGFQYSDIKCFMVGEVFSLQLENHKFDYDLFLHNLDIVDDVADVDGFNLDELVGASKASYIRAMEVDYQPDGETIEHCSLLIKNDEVTSIVLNMFDSLEGGYTQSKMIVHGYQYTRFTLNNLDDMDDSDEIITYLIEQYDKDIENYGSSIREGIYRMFWNDDVVTRQSKEYDRNNRYGDRKIIKLDFSEI